MIPRYFPGHEIDAPRSCMDRAKIDRCDIYLWKKKRLKS